MAKFIAYYRVSTARQGRSGLGLEAQQAAVASLVSFNGNKLVAEYREVESGAVRERPQLAAALNHCRVTGATLVVAKMDRLSREAGFIRQLIDGDVSIRFCDLPSVPEGPIGKLLLGVLSEVAELERALISRRTKEAMAAAKDRGRTFGNPNGAAALVAYRAKGAATSAKVRGAKADEAAQRLAPIIAELRAAGIDTAKGIARELNARHITTPGRKGGDAEPVPQDGADQSAKGKWSATQVRRLLERIGE